ncbi:MAG: M56 family metallopeptidase [Fimbriimonas sp.]
MLDAIVVATLQGLAVLLLVWGFLRLFPRIAPSWRQALWWIACLKFPLGLLWLVPITLPILPQSSQPYTVTGAGKAESIAAALPAAEAVSAPQWPLLMLVAWALGAVACFGRLALDAVSLRRIVRAGVRIDGNPLGETLRLLAVRMGLQRPPALIESDAISSPMVVGLLRPTILVPTGFGEEFAPAEREMALAHELAHLRRGDLWTGLVPALARALFWFLPPLHWATREWETEREAACDAEAIALTQAAPPTYGRLLLDIVAKDDRRAVASALGATAGFHTLKRRIASVGQPDRPVPALALAVPILAFLPWMPIAPAAPQGVLLNAGIEEGEGSQPAHWSRGARISSVVYGWDREHAHSGRGSLAISKAANRYFPIAEWSQTFKHDGRSTAVEVSAWIRAESMYKAVLDVQFAQPDGVESHQWAAYIGARQDGDPPATHGWKRVGAIVKIPPGTTEIIIAPQVYGPGKVWFDDIEARFTNEAPTQEVAP